MRGTEWWGWGEGEAEREGKEGEGAEWECKKEVNLLRVKSMVF